MNLNVNDDTMKTIVAGAVLQALTPENRDQLLKDAVVHLITPKKDGYGYGREAKSPLQEAFEQAMYGITRDIVKDKLTNDEGVRKQIEDVIATGLNRAFVERREDTINAVARGVQQFLSIEK